MMRRRPDACVVHRPVLIDFVEHRAIGPDSPAALDHLARCGTCERDLSEVAQTVIALRRLGEHAGAFEAPADGWMTLRGRLERSQRAADDAAGRLRRAFSGAVVALAVIGMVAVTSLTGTVTSGLDESLAGVDQRAGGVPAARRYDPYAQRLTEGIVLAIAGGEPARISRADANLGSPFSTDRRDRTRVVVILPTTPQPSAPRTAFRT
jgi:hypothetical protein